MKTITIGLSPNTQKQDIQKALQNIFSPLRYIQGFYVKNLEQWFRNCFGVSYAVSFNSGRSALYGILKCLSVGKNDEVLLQAFTCVVVPNGILSLGAKPVYIDITPDLTMDPDDLKSKITNKTKAILLQHTFGIPSHMEKILHIAKEHNIIVIEDCAHTLGGLYDKKKLGTVGDIAFFSFGRDKPFSSVFGGMAITNNEKYGKKLRNFQKNLPYPSTWWVMQQLMHPLISGVALPTYDLFRIGKILLVGMQKIKALSFPVSEDEKKGVFDTAFVQKFPNALADLALVQLKKMKDYNRTRERIGELYTKNLIHDSIRLVYTKKAPLLRFPILVQNPSGFVSFLRKNKVYVGRWYSEIIDPPGTDLKSVGYTLGSCPIAEKMAKEIVNLPTIPTMTLEDAERIIALVKEYAYFRNRK